MRTIRQWSLDLWEKWESGQPQRKLWRADKVRRFKAFSLWLRQKVRAKHKRKVPPTSTTPNPVSAVSRPKKPKGPLIAIVLFLSVTSLGIAYLMRNVESQKHEWREWIIGAVMLVATVAMVIIAIRSATAKGERREEEDEERRPSGDRPAPPPRARAEGKSLGATIFTIFRWLVFVGLLTWVVLTQCGTYRNSEVWEFRWWSDKMIKGMYGCPFTVDVLVNDSESFVGNLQYNVDGAIQNLGDLHLGKVGNNLVGTWLCFADGDGGECFLHKIGDGYWSGHHINKHGDSIDCSLTRKVVRRGLFPGL